MELKRLHFSNYTRLIIMENNLNIKKGNHSKNI